MNKEENLKLKKLAETAHKNARAGRWPMYGHWCTADVSFQNPQWDRGYGVILRVLYNDMYESKRGRDFVPMRSSKQLIEAVDNHKMTYVTAITRLLAAKLVERPVKNCYKISKLGEKYCKAWLKY